jgi:cytoskeleton protein RodZ
MAQAGMSGHRESGTQLNAAAGPDAVSELMEAGIRDSVGSLSTDTSSGRTGLGGAGSVASRVGNELRTARERLGWELPAMAAHLRIRLPFLEAIEQGRTHDLPGTAYALGFVRTYAQALGLDSPEIAQRFRAEATSVRSRTELTFPAPVPERGLPAGAVVLVGAVLAIGAYVGWYHSSSLRPSAEVRSVPERLAALVEPPPPPVAQPAPAPAPAEAAIETLDLPVMPSVPPSSAAAAMPFHPPPPDPAAAATTPAAPGAGTPASAALPQLPDGTRVVLRARADAWVQVRDKTGPVLLNRVMRAGEIWPVPTKGVLLLTTGNAGGTELVLDGVVAMASLGGDGVVRRDLSLDADAIKDGKLAPAVVAKPAAPAAKQP